jgi:hypothetical protein
MADKDSGGGGHVGVDVETDGGGGIEVVNTY